MVDKRCVFLTNNAVHGLDSVERTCTHECDAVFEMSIDPFLHIVVCYNPQLRNRLDSEVRAFALCWL